MHLTLRLLPLFALLAAAACVTPGLYPPPARGPVLPPSPAHVLRRQPSERGVPVVSPELGAMLSAFSQQARAHREIAARADQMPDPQRKNWLGLTGELDRLLARPVGETPPQDLQRARQVVEAELEQDSRTYSELPPEVVDGVLERIAKLGTRLEEARQAKAKRGATRVAKAAFAWPVDPVAVTSPFGRRRHPFRHEYVPHLGVDLAAKRGQEISVAADGVVLRAQWTNGHGNHVDVDHGGGVMTRYSHLSALQVKPGHELKQGDVVGLAGDTGLTTGVHLHFELWRGDQPMDPLEELDAPRRAVAVSNR